MMSETQKTFSRETTVETRSVTMTKAAWAKLDRIRQYLDRIALEVGSTMEPVEEAEAILVACECFIDRHMIDQQALPQRNTS